MTAAIKPIDGRSIHLIQSGQVIVDLCSVAKELVENSIDAGSSIIDIRFKNQGLDSIEVQDNGSGISPSNYEAIALKHHTSKLSTYSDIASLQTFGFRGEALASLSAVSTLTIATCLDSEAPRGSRLSFEASGKLSNVAVTAAQRGTIVTVENLFHNLPVRRRELERNIKREWHKVIALLNQYACIQTNLKFSVSQQPSKGKRILLFSTKSNPTTRENIINIFGAKTFSTLIALELELEMQTAAKRLQTTSKPEADSSSRQVRVSGHVSRPIHGDGRQTPDRQMLFVNGRPCGLPQFAKIFNEVYKTYNYTQSPFIFADIQLDTHSYDVNVSPDKRSILLHDQGELLDRLRCSLLELFESHEYRIPTNQLSSKRPAGSVGSSSEPDMERQADEGLSVVQFRVTSEPEKDDSSRITRSRNADKRKYAGIQSVSDRTQIPRADRPSNDDRGLSKWLRHDTGVSASPLPNHQYSDDIPIQPTTSPSREADHDEGTRTSQVLTGDSIDVDSTHYTADLSTLTEQLQRDHRDHSSGIESHCHTDNMKQWTELRPDTDNSETSAAVDNQSDPDNTADNRSKVFGDTPSPRSLLGDADIGIRRSADTHGIEAQDDLLSIRLDGEDHSFKPHPDKAVRRHAAIPCNSTNKLLRKSSTVEDVQTIRTSEMITARQIDHVGCHSTRGRNRALQNEIEEIDSPEAEERLGLIVAKEHFAKMRVVGQFNLGFIIAIRPAQTDPSLPNDAEHDELLIIDQHASDEKFNFEKLQKDTVVQSQNLVNSKLLDLTALEEEIVFENLATLEANGFKIELDASGNAPVGSRCRLLALPLSRETTFTLRDLEELIAILADAPAGSGHISRPSKVRKMFAMRACRSSIMIGKALTSNQMYALVRHMGELDKPWNCPHGRPTMRHLCRLQTCDEAGWTEDLPGSSTQEAWISYARGRRRHAQN